MIETTQEGLSTYHLGTTHRSYQPAKGNFFEFVLEDFGDLLRPGVSPRTAQESDYIQNGQEVIRLTVSKAGIPHFTLNDIQVKKGNSIVHYAGTPTFNETSIVVDDMIGAESKAVLEAWQNRAYMVSTDKGGRAYDYKLADGTDVKGYKRNATLIEYTSDHVEVRSWVLHGCWVSELSEDDYDKTNDDLRQVTAKIVYDYAEPTVEPQNIAVTTGI